MPSSTSSSRLPRGRWGQSWALIAFTVVAVISFQEHRLREALMPSAVDDQALWATWRYRAADGRRDTIVLLGSSRMLSAIALDRFGAVGGSRAPIQLAINGNSPIPVLESLAADPAFRGLAIVGIAPDLVFRGPPSASLVSRLWVRQFERQPPSWFQRTERLMVAHVQSHLTVRIPFAAQEQLLDDAGRVTRRRYVAPGREMRLWFSPSFAHQRAKVIADSIDRSLAPAQRQRQQTLERLARAAAAIRARGGKVILVRLPSSGVVRAAESRRYPRAQYWDRLSDLGVDAAIHFEDIPTLRKFTCADGSHLDRPASRAFTTALAAWLRQQELI